MKVTAKVKLKHIPHPHEDGDCCIHCVLDGTGQCVECGYGYYVYSKIKKVNLKED